ncbi:MAG: nuclear transport factor 2 family protein [Myxococcota bacterium]
MTFENDPLFAFLDYVRAFEEGLAHSEWGGVRARLADDARYQVRGPVPFACEVEGADAVVAAFERSVSGFDRKVEQRRLEIRSVARLPGDRVVAELHAGYRRSGAPAVEFPVSVEARLTGGRIAEMTDDYDGARCSAALEWFAAHGEGLDPRYLHEE